MERISTYRVDKVVLDVLVLVVLVLSTTTRSILYCTVLISTYLIRRVHRKWHSVQRLVTHNARKTLRMVRLSGGPQYPIEDRSEALAALLQRL